MKRPLIGVTCFRERAAFGVWNCEMDFLQWDLVTKLAEAGSTPIAIPPTAAIDGRILERLDALLIGGGGDIDPGRYGGEAGPGIEDVDAERDEVEFTLARAALAQDLPILGICRGHQVLAAAAGGRLLQDIPISDWPRHRPVAATFEPHEVDLVEGSQLHQILGPRAVVPSHHHQAVERMPAGWAVTGTAPDGMIEAIERPCARFAVGVQWHPEASSDSRLFQALVEHARGPQAASGPQPVTGCGP
jgi:putative glutamine amidotransferase